MVSQFISSHWSSFSVPWLEIILRLDPTTAPSKSICYNRKTYLIAWPLFWTFKLWVQTHEIWLSRGSCWWTRQPRLKILFYLGFSLYLFELDFNLYNMLKSSDLLVFVFTISHDFYQLHKYLGTLIIRNKTSDSFIILSVWNNKFEMCLILFYDLFSVWFISYTWKEKYFYSLLGTAAVYQNV